MTPSPRTRRASAPRASQMRTGATDRPDCATCQRSPGSLGRATRPRARRRRRRWGGRLRSRKIGRSRPTLQGRELDAGIGTQPRQLVADQPRDAGLRPSDHRPGTGAQRRQGTCGLGAGQTARADVDRPYDQPHQATEDRPHDPGQQRRQGGATGGQAEDHHAHLPARDGADQPRQTEDEASERPSDQRRRSGRRQGQQDHSDHQADERALTGAQHSTGLTAGGAGGASPGDGDRTHAEVPVRPAPHLERLDGLPGAHLVVESANHQQLNGMHRRPLTRGRAHVIDVSSREPGPPDISDGT